MKGESVVHHIRLAMRNVAHGAIAPILVVFTGCTGYEIFPLNPVTANVYGRALVDGRPLVGAQVTAAAIPGTCAAGSVASGVTRTDSAGRYRVRIDGNAQNGVYCLRLSVGVAPGDTLVTRDSVFLRTEAPFDSVQVDVQR
jgi:hypothetical protein